MQGTYPLFTTKITHAGSQLKAMCRPVEGQLLNSNNARQALDNEVRSRPGKGTLSVKFGAARWFKDSESRRIHRAAAWDVARAALRTDVQRIFCAESPELVDRAWAASRMPERGQAITLRQVVQLSRLADYLSAFCEPKICDGTDAKYLEASAKLRIALVLYRRDADSGLQGDPTEGLSALASNAYTHLQQSDGKGAVVAIDQALRNLSPVRQVPAAPLAQSTQGTQDTLTEDDFAIVSDLTDS